MKLDKTRFTTLLLLAVPVLVCCTHTGCNRDVVYTTDNQAYEQDPDYRSALDCQRAEQVSIGKRRSAIAKSMRELISACGGDKAKAEKLPQWAKLVAEADECDKMISANRDKTAAIVRERINRAVRDTERVRAGKAEAKDISK